MRLQTRRVMDSSPTRGNEIFNITHLSRNPSSNQRKSGNRSVLTLDFQVPSVSPTMYSIHRIGSIVQLLIMFILFQVTA